MICKGDRILVGNYAVLVTNAHELDEKPYLICNIYLVFSGRYRSSYEKLNTITIGVHEYEKLRKDRDMNMLNALMNKSA